jgi:hypothetical protein
MEVEIFSGRGAYVVLRPSGEWAFVHDLLPDAWFRASGTGLTCMLRPWARLPRGATWVPTARSVGSPWRYDATGPDPEALPRDEAGQRLVLVGPVRCDWQRAGREFRLLRGKAAVAAAREAVRANMLARLLLDGASPIAVRAWDARIAVSQVDWDVWEHDEAVYMIARHGERVLLADNDWVAGASSVEEALAALAVADREHGIG